MPLTLGGAAHYNIGNAAGAALVAQALGIAPTHIAAVLARFGARNADNPGRLQRWRRDGVEVLLDYAHNPDGLQGLLEMARVIAPKGRLGLLLGQAGNREDQAIRALARTAAQASPHRVVLKDLPSAMINWDRVHLNHIGAAVLARAVLTAVGFEWTLRLA